jgi:serine/threonine-protein kinase
MLDGPEENWVGRTIGGRYAVADVLGIGGMGTVFDARDLVGGGQVAIKMLNRTAVTTTNVRRLRQEAEIALRLDHEHVCRVQYLGFERDAPFVVMERLDGESLRKWLRREGSLSGPDAITIAIQVLDALQAAHATGVIHRDVKPSNIFVTRPSKHALHIKLIDFGLAKVVRRPSVGDEEITGADVVPGTPQYLTPEQVRGERELDARVDVWATALTLFEMLSGERALSTELVYEELARKILYERVPTVAAVRPDLPQEIDDVLAQALAKDRQRRFVSALAFRTALVAVWSQHRAQGIARGRAVLRPPPRGRSTLEDRSSDQWCSISPS